MPLRQLLPSTELVILPKVDVWHKQGKVCALHLTCMSTFPGRAWQELAQQRHPRRGAWRSSLLPKSAPSAPRAGAAPQNSLCFNGLVSLWSASLHLGTVNLTTCVPHTAAPCAVLLRQLYPSLPPLLSGSLSESLGEGDFQLSLPLSLKGVEFAIFLLFSAFLKALLQVSNCFCFC